MKPRLVVILGPTAAGKSESAVDLATEIGAEIINADSQQVYRYMDIGTGKPAMAVRARIPHHLIDVVDPDGEFNVAMFRALAIRSAEDIWSRNKPVIVCGGTGLYIKALTRGLFTGPGQDAAIRGVLADEIDAAGLGGLYARLERIDPVAAVWIHPNDRQRIVRALEVYELTGKPISFWQKQHAFSESPFEVLQIGLARERAELYTLINQRCDQMIAAGLVEEVKGLVAKGYSLGLKSLQSVGYRQVGLFLGGDMTLDEAVTLMKRDTRRLAKRQLTWFRREDDILWLHPEREKEKIKRLGKDFLVSRIPPP
ncbi:MAG TPA: tRNA (adenosine(37)-N6)-dimethylallyltransferase MiaA [Candidatus Binatia bacterium]|nr:tRNA (adenosine(37)-N6)-dimethylallyltransferase MiaA [Candidatus Binatia bacterium]